MQCHPAALQETTGIRFSPHVFPLARWCPSLVSGASPSAAVPANLCGNPFRSLSCKWLSTYNGFTVLDKSCMALEATFANTLQGSMNKGFPCLSCFQISYHTLGQCVCPNNVTNVTQTGCVIQSCMNKFVHVRVAGICPLTCLQEHCIITRLTKSG